MLKISKEVENLLGLREGEYSKIATAIKASICQQISLQHLKNNQEEIVLDCGFCLARWNSEKQTIQLSRIELDDKLYKDILENKVKQLLEQEGESYLNG